MAFESKKDFPLSPENFPQRLTIFNQNFTRLLFVYIYTTTDNVQNFIRLSLTLAKLCYMKRASTLNFFTHVSRKKSVAKIATVWAISTKFGTAERAYRLQVYRCRTCLEVYLDGGQPMRSRDRPILHHRAKFSCWPVIPLQKCSHGRPHI